MGSMLAHMCCSLNFRFNATMQSREASGVWRGRRGVMACTRGAKAYEPTGMGGWFNEAFDGVLSGRI